MLALAVMPVVFVLDEEMFGTDFSVTATERAAPFDMSD